MPLKTRLGLIAVGHVALHSDQGWIPGHSISKTYGLPELYLRKVMSDMVNANILKSRHGPHGGFQLARPAKDISVLEIVEAAEGPTVFKIHMPQVEGTPLFNAGLEEVLERSSDRATRTLQKTTLKHMVELAKGRISEMDGGE